VGAQVLGCGGIGQDVALTLARLGVNTIILVDNDTYDASNLTRQCLGTPSQVGQTKVRAAGDTLRSCHCLRSRVEEHCFDAIANWASVVALARRSDVIFNGIDVGPLWDHAVNGLALELGLTLVQGQSFGWTLNVELYSGRPGCYCASCEGSPSEALFGLDGAKGSPKGVAAVAQRLTDFRRARGGALGGVLGGASGEAAVLAAFLWSDSAFRLGKGSAQGAPPAPSVLAAAEQALAKATAETAAAGATEAATEAVPGRLAAFLKALRAFVLESLLPGAVGLCDDLWWLPRPTSIATRSVGSWVCPCLGAGVLMVSQWAALLTGPVEAPGAVRNPATSLTLDLSVGLTSEERCDGRYGD